MFNVVRVLDSVGALITNRSGRGEGGERKKRGKKKKREKKRKRTYETVVIDRSITTFFR